MKIVPLNSLVILAGLNIDDARQKFNAADILDASDISKLVGPRNRPLDSFAYMEYVWDLSKIRLRCGERVVLFAPQISYDDKLEIIARATKIGVHSIFLHNGEIKDYPKAACQAEIIDAAKPLKIVDYLSDKDISTELISLGFKGITVVPDLHGDMRALRAVVSHAKSNSNFLLFLGDLIDYGPEPLRVVEEVYHLIVNGEAECLMGNHERKIFRYLNQVKTTGDSRIRLSDGNLVTLTKLAELTSSETTVWVNKFHALVNTMRHHRVIGKNIFAHGGINREMIKCNSFRLSGDLESTALFGAVERNSSPTNSMVRSYSWVDSIPDGYVGFVGHDRRGTDEPLVITNDQGGKVFFMDTGCGKGGHLTTVDIDLKTSNVGEFNIH